MIIGSSLKLSKIKKIYKFDINKTKYNNILQSKHVDYETSSSSEKQKSGEKNLPWFLPLDWNLICRLINLTFFFIMISSYPQQLNTISKAV